LEGVFVLAFGDGSVADFKEIGCAGDAGEGDAVGWEIEDAREHVE
jgi:hypothetical protein